MTVEMIHDLGKFYSFGEPVSHSKFTIVPLLGNFSTPIISIIEAEKKESGWIEETDSVQVLKAINKGIPYLIPYLHQVEGGKQDRTIFEPIIVPEGRGEANPLDIPARCIEQSRWRYSSSRGEATSKKFKSSKTRMASQMSYSSSRYEAQEVVWDNVAASASAMGLTMEDAPTSSYLEMNAMAFEKKEDLKELKEKLLPGTKVDGQVGVVCFYGDKILGMEIYGSTSLWNHSSEEVLKGFLIDQYFLKNLETKDEITEDIRDILKQELKDVKISKMEATGTGELYKFNDEKWEGIAVLFDGIPVHLHAVKEQVRIADQSRSRGRVEQMSNVEPVQAIQQMLAPEITGRITPQEQREEEEFQNRE
ncbi:MAG: ARPP-1 family domain-containing protein [Candidatus Odinarchaeota archaeon]